MKSSEIIQMLLYGTALLFFCLAGFAFIVFVVFTIGCIVEGNKAANFSGPMAMRDWDVAKAIGCVFIIAGMLSYFLMQMRKSFQQKPKPDAG